MEHVTSKNIVATQCKRLRSQLGWTQNDLVARCQMMEWMISRATLAKIEGGFRRVNDAEVALLARALNTSPNALLDLPLPRLLDTARHGDTPDTGLDLMAADEEE